MLNLFFIGSQNDDDDDDDADSPFFHKCAQSGYAYFPA